MYQYRFSCKRYLTPCASAKCSSGAARLRQGLTYLRSRFAVRFQSTNLTSMTNKPAKPNNRSSISKTHLTLGLASQETPGGLSRRWRQNRCSLPLFPLSPRCTTRCEMQGVALCGQEKLQVKPIQDTLRRRCHRWEHIRIEGVSMFLGAQPLLRRPTSEFCFPKATWRKLLACIPSAASARWPSSSGWPGLHQTPREQVSELVTVDLQLCL